MAAPNPLHNRCVKRDADALPRRSEAISAPVLLRIRVGGMGKEDRFKCHVHCPIFVWMGSGILLNVLRIKEVAEGNFGRSLISLLSAVK